MRVALHVYGQHLPSCPAGQLKNLVCLVRQNSRAADRLEKNEIVRDLIDVGRLLLDEAATFLGNGLASIARPLAPDDSYTTRSKRPRSVSPAVVVHSDRGDGEHLDSKLTVFLGKELAS